VRLAINRLWRRFALNVTAFAQFRIIIVGDATSSNIVDVDKLTVDDKLVK
jgi:hypothetical protein